MTKNKLIVILGPTGSGKTSLSLKLAKEFNGAIISADSRAIYKEMNIGTAKPEHLKPNFRKNPLLPIFSENVPHYLININKLNQPLTLSQYQKLVKKCLLIIKKQGKTAFLVGGTGLYIKSITFNYAIPKVKPNLTLRKSLEYAAKKYGNQYLYQILLHYDPECESFIDPNNTRRIIRALEVFFSTGKPFSCLRKTKKSQLDVLKIGIKIPREKLYANIEKRVDKMIEKGLVKEVKKLWQKYPNNPILLNTIGYSEIISFLKKKISLEQAINQIKKNTKNFAKRQITWFKKEPNIHWVKNYQQAKNLIKCSLKN